MKAAKKMTKKMLQAYQQNWKVVNEITTREAELISTKRRVSKISLLMQLALAPMPPNPSQSTLSGGGPVGKMELADEMAAAVEGRVHDGTSLA